MNYAKIQTMDIVNGEGVRVSLFVSGCPHKCKGCFNQELWNYDAGRIFDRDTIEEILKLCDKYYVAGLSLLGGEPLDPHNLAMLTILCSAFKRHFPQKDIWCYTGYKWEDVKQLYIMRYIDVLVDGKFVQNLANPCLKFRGSSNQRIIDVKKSVDSGCVVLRKDLMME